MRVGSIKLTRGVLLSFLRLLCYVGGFKLPRKGVIDDVNTFVINEMQLSISTRP